MYKQLEISNFRCFDRLVSEGLCRANIVVGLNNSGKTSYLEALFALLGGHNPRMPFSLNSFRGMDRVVPDAEQQWGWLFYNQDTANPAFVVARDEAGRETRLEIGLGDQARFDRGAAGPGTSRPQAANGLAPTPTPAPVDFDLLLDFSDPSGFTCRSRLSLGLDGAPRSESLGPVDRQKARELKACVFMATRARSGNDDVDRLSSLQKRRNDAAVVSLLQALDPSLRGLSILTIGGVPVIHAAVGDKDLVPLHIVGEGVGRLLSIALAMLTTPGGVVLIDEIENGVHHSALRKMWVGIANLAATLDVQVFATTHSAECVEAAHYAVAEGHQGDLGVIQLFRLKSGVRCRTLDDRHIRAALNAEIELR